MPPPDARAGTAVAGQSVAATYWGVFAAAGQGSVLASATVTNPGVLGNILISGQASITATPTLLVMVAGRAVIAGQGAVTATATVDKLARVTVAGQGALNLAGLAERRGAVLIAGQGAATYTAKLNYAASLLIAGQGSISATATILGTVTGNILVAGQGSINASATVAYSGRVTVTGQGAITATGGITMSGRAVVAGSGTVTLAGLLEKLGRAVVSGQAAVLLDGKVDHLASILIGGQAALTLTGRAIWAGRNVIAGQATLTLNGRMIYVGRVVIGGPGLSVLTIRGTRIGAMPPRRLLVEVFEVDGDAVIEGPFVEILGASYTQELDRIGSFELVIPAAHERAAIFQQRREVHLYREGEGLIFKGIVGSISTEARDEAYVATIRGSSLSRKLVFKTTGRGLTYNNQTLAAVTSSLLSGTGIGVGQVAVLPNNLVARMDSATRWAALEGIARQAHVHMREDLLTETIDMHPLGTDTGIVLRNVEAVSPALDTNAAVIPVSGVSIDEESEDLWNRLYPLGSGEGNNALDLGPSNRTTGGGAPYAIQSEVGPDGRTQYFIEDITSVVAYGRSEKWVSVKEAIPLSNDVAAFTAAANALYDVASAYLQVLSVPRREYAVQVPGLRHLDYNGNYRFQVGDKMRLDYRGLASSPTAGTVVWHEVNQLLWITGYSRRFREDGGDDWTLKVATVDRQERDIAERLADIQADVLALSVSPKPYNYERSNGPYRSSVDATHPLDFNVKWDDGTFLLHRSKLTFRVRGVRSNSTGAASGGGSSTTSDSGGGGTSGADTSHTHSISGQSASGGGSHDHALSPLGTWGKVYAYGISHTSSTDPATLLANHNHASATTDSGGGAGGAHAHTVSGGTGSMGGTWQTRQFMVDMGITFPDIASTETNHTHSVTGTTSGGGSSHSHTTPSHTHGLTLAAHTHAVTYGIFQASTPSTPQVTISINGTSRTAALGGPWNTGQELDITPYLTTGTFGQPLRQDNTITLGANTLCDIEVEVHSMAASTSIALPV